MPKATSDTDAPSRRAERRAAQQDISRTQLLDAAEEVFGQKGFHEATLREVADLAEFSVGSLYSFFEGKDELFSQIFLRRVDEFMPALAAVLNDEAADPRQQLHALVDFQIGFFRAHPNFGRLYLRYSSGTGLTIDSEVDAILNARYDDAMARQGALIRRGQELGVFHPGDPDVFARLLSGLVSAYQALDPAVATGQPEAGERLPLVDFHAVIDRTFVAKPMAKRARRAA